jgi:imidazolonepropionase-like amidohydrolase
VTKRRGHIILSFMLGFVVTHQAVGETQSVLALTHATVIDATGAPAQADLTVVMADGRISATGPSADVHPPTNAIIRDATGKFLIPGLWDMHVHWYDRECLPLFIANGVTGIRMMWGSSLHHQWRKEIEQGSLIGPRLLIASTIVDGPKPFWPGSMTASNAAEGRLAVAQARQEGADFVKVYSLLPRDAYFEIAKEARKEGIPFEGHVPISISVEEASEAGQKTIEHLTGVLPACSSREAELLKSAQEALAGVLATNSPASILPALRQINRLALESYSPAKAEALFAELKKNQTWQCPTLTVLRNMRYIDEPSITNDTRIKYMPRGIRSHWDPAGDDRFKGRTPADAALGKRIYQKELEIAGAMQRAGVGILAGTDTGNPYCFPGFSLHDELGLLVHAGLTPMQALQAATRNAARFMGRETDLGTIEQGKLADLVLLDANPLDDIANTRKINAVLLGGKLFSRVSLDESLAKIEALASSSKRPIADALLETIGGSGVDAAIRQYRELKSTKAEAYDFNEDQLNDLAYVLFGSRRIKEAIQILKLNAESFPQSSNVYDSLGEVYMADGEMGLAIQNYEKSLKLDPANRNAAEKLKELKAH